MSSSQRRFAGFPAEGLRLLGGLERHNERSWFAARKEVYERALLAPMRAFVDDASAALQRAKIPIGGDHKRSIFRIYRDVRFSPDKRPYRTNMATYLSYDGGRTTPGGLYVEVGARASYLSIAFYLIERPMLQRWRRAMAERPAAFARVLAALRRAGLEIMGPAEWDDALSRMPRGFEAHAASELAPYFRLRSFCVHRDIAQRDVTSATLVERSVAMAKDCRPLLDFGWSLD